MKFAHCCQVMGALIAVVAGLAACGGGGTEAPEAASPKLVSGVAASGGAISGTVYLKDAGTPAKEISTPIAADGSFSLGVSGLTAPFLLKAVGSANGNAIMLFSFAGTAGTANINPLSHLAVSDAYGNNELASLYNSPDPAALRAIRQALPNSLTKIQAIFQPTLARFGAAHQDFISGAYAINHLGLDLLLDLVSISTNNGTLTVVDKTSNQTVTGLVNSFQINPIDVVPSPPPNGGVCILAGERSVFAGGTISFKAVLAGASSPTVNWSVVETQAGVIDSSGLYTAPGSAGTYHIRATNPADASKYATVAVTVAVSAKPSFDKEKSWKQTATVDVHPAATGSPGTIYDVAIADNLVFIAEGTAGLYIYDTSDPSLPRQVGAIPPDYAWTPDATDTFYHVAVSGNVVAIAIETGCTGLCGPRSYFITLYDVSDPSAPKRLSSIPWSTYDLGMIFEGKYLYYCVYDRNNSQTVFQVVDVSNPATPTVVGSVSNMSLGARVKVGDLIVAADGNNVPDIISVADPAHPVVESYITGSYYSSVVSLAVYNSNVYLAGYYNSAYIYSIANISNAASPIALGTLPSVAGTSPLVAGHYLYTTNAAGVTIYDVASPQNPVLFKTITVPTPTKLFSFTDRVGVIVSQEVYDHGTYGVLLKPEQISFFTPGQ